MLRDIDSNVKGRDVLIIDDILESGNTLKAASEKFEREAPTLSESQRTARQKQLVEQDRDFQRKRREFQEDLNTRKNEEFQQVLHL